MKPNIQALKDCMKLKQAFWKIVFVDKVFIYAAFLVVAAFAWILRFYLASLARVGPNAEKVNSVLSQGIITRAVASDLNIVTSAVNIFLLKAIPTLLLFVIILAAVYTATKSYGWSVIKGKKLTLNSYIGYFSLTAGWFLVWTASIIAVLFLLKDPVNVYTALILFFIFLHTHSHIFYAYDHENTWKSIMLGVKRAFSIRAILISLLVAPVIPMILVMLSYFNTISIPALLVGLGIMTVVFAYTKIIVCYLTCLNEG